jgi:hypothetical protein
MKRGLMVKAVRVPLPLNMILKDAARLAIGCASLLVIAGIIEGFLSPSNLPAFFKYGTGILTGMTKFARHQRRAWTIDDKREAELRVHCTPLLGAPTPKMSYTPAFIEQPQWRN